MEPVRPLRDVLAGLAEPGPDGEPLDARAELAAGGHGDLPDDLLVTAIAGYAGTAPAEVAEHLAPFLDAPDAATGLDLLTSAPAGPFDGEVPLDGAGTEDVDDLDGTSGLLGTADDLDGAEEPDASGDLHDLDDLHDLHDLQDLDALDAFDDLPGTGTDAAPDPGDLAGNRFGDAAPAVADTGDVEVPVDADLPAGFDDPVADDVATADAFDAGDYGLPQAPVDDAADTDAPDDLDDVDG